MEALRTVRSLPPITDEDGDCAFCWGANHSSEEPVDEGGHHSWCPYAAILSDLATAAVKHDADVLARERERLLAAVARMPWLKDEAVIHAAVVALLSQEAPRV